MVIDDTLWKKILHIYIGNICQQQPELQILQYLLYPTYCNIFTNIIDLELIDVICAPISLSNIAIFWSWAIYCNSYVFSLVLLQYIAIAIYFSKVRVIVTSMMMMRLVMKWSWRWSKGCGSADRFRGLRCNNDDDDEWRSLLLLLYTTIVCCRFRWWLIHIIESWIWRRIERCMTTYL